MHTTNLARLARVFCTPAILTIVEDFSQTDRENIFFRRIVKQALVFSVDSYQPSLKINENPGSILSLCT